MSKLGFYYDLPINKPRGMFSRDTHLSTPDPGSEGLINDPVSINSNAGHREGGHIHRGDLHQGYEGTHDPSERPVPEKQAGQVERDVQHGHHEVRQGQVGDENVGGTAAEAGVANHDVADEGVAEKTDQYDGRVASDDQGVARCQEL